MRPIDKAVAQKQNETGLALVTRFLNSLDAVTQVQQTQTEWGDALLVQYSKEKQHRIILIADDGKTEGLFVETFVTTRPNQSYNTQASVGLLFASSADYLFYLSGQVLYTLPLARFRYWVDHNSDAFRQDCYFENSGGCEVRHHGLIVPRQRLRTDFAKGDVRVSVFRLKNSTDADQFDYIQEF